jgi:SAM-dependent methyltransferase
MEEPFTEVSPGQQARTITTCPGCGGADFAPTGVDTPPFSVTLGGRQFVQPSDAVRECATCGLLYRTRPLSRAEFDDYYRLVDFRKWETLTYYPTERAVLAVLRTLPRGSRLLDFGCSSGRLLATLVDEYHCFGCEINPDAADAAAVRGLKMLNASALAEQESEQFEAIVMVDVFEHLPNPALSTQALFRLLKHDGLLVVVTGNGDAKACRLDPAQFWYFRTVEHVCMLTRRHADYLARRCSAQLERWEGLSHYDTPLREQLLQRLRHFAYWQFRRQTFLSRTLLSLLPRIRRAKHWLVAPAFTCSADHVLAIFRKLPPCVSAELNPPSPLNR